MQLVNKRTRKTNNNNNNNNNNDNNSDNNNNNRSRNYYVMKTESRLNNLQPRSRSACMPNMVVLLATA